MEDIPWAWKPHSDDCSFVFHGQRLIVVVCWYVDMHQNNPNLRTFRSYVRVCRLCLCFTNTKQTNVYFTLSLWIECCNESEVVKLFEKNRSIKSIPWWRWWSCACFVRWISKILNVVCGHVMTCVKVAQGGDISVEEKLGHHRNRQIQTPDWILFFLSR